MHRFAVRRDDLLWRTRGRSWDYEFITRPKRKWKDRSYLVTTQVFSVGAAPVPSNIVGLVEGETYLACSVLDPERRDEFGRPVQHYVLWLVPEGALHGDLAEILASTHLGRRRTGLSADVGRLSLGRVQFRRPGHHRQELAAPRS